MATKVSGAGPLNAEIMIVGEAPGKDEVRHGIPFVGASGRFLDRMLQVAGIPRESVRVENVVGFRPPRNNIQAFFDGASRGLSPVLGRNPGPIVRAGCRELYSRIDQVRPSTIIALGGTALWALTGHAGGKKGEGIDDWAGSVVPLVPETNHQCRVIPTFHPARVLRQFELRPFVEHDLKRAKRETQYGPEIRPWAGVAHTRPRFEEVHVHLAKIEADLLQGPVFLAQDIETFNRHITCAGIAWSAQEGLCIPFVDFDSPTLCYWSTPDEVEIISRLSKILSHPNARVIGHNYDYDTQYLARYWGCLPNLAHDTMTVGHALFCRWPKSLAFNARMYCDNYIYWKQDGKDHNPRRYNQDDYWLYNVKDCCYTYEVAMEQRELAQYWPKVEGEAAWERQMAFHPQYTQAMLRGVKKDLEYSSKLGMRLSRQIASREQFLNDVIGRPFNPRSPKQMKELFYEELGQQKNYNFVKGRRTLTCNKEALAKIGKRTTILRPLTDTIEDIRALGQMRAVVLGPVDKDGRIRCQYSVPGTDTFRQNSKKDAFGFGTNLQNLTVGNEAEVAATGADLEDDDVLYFPNVRKILVPDPGYVIMEVDLKAADAQVVAAECEDEEWLAQLLDDDFDLHTYHAMEIWGFRREEVTYHRRQMFGKTFVHATNYGAAAKTIGSTLGVSTHRADQAQKRYFQIRPGVHRWHTRVLNKLQVDGYVENRWGYRSYFFERVADIFKEALAWIPQSTVAIATNEGVRRTLAADKERLLQFLLQTHDSAAFQFPNHRITTGSQLILQNMPVAIPYDPPLTIGVDGDWSRKSWGDCK